jgi:hypothetical protein
MTADARGSSGRMKPGKQVQLVDAVTKPRPGETDEQYWRRQPMPPLWPTPTTEASTRTKPFAQGGMPLSLAGNLWPTPTASLGTKGGRVTQRKGRNGGTLIEAVSMFPTPTARDWKSGSKGQQGAPRQRPALERDDWWTVEPDLGRVAYGVPFRVDQLRCLGNAVVPQVAAMIGEWIMQEGLD